MRQVICPLDGKPREQDCPDRYIDQPEGGCILTTAEELGAQVVVLDEASGTVGCIYAPHQAQSGKGVS